MASTVETGNCDAEQRDELRQATVPAERRYGDCDVHGAEQQAGAGFVTNQH
jgi:hypothetical protein